LQGPDSSISEAVKRRIRLRGEGVKEGKDDRIIIVAVITNVYVNYIGSRDNGIPYSVVENIYLHTN
jgi:hypothetical protein